MIERRALHRREEDRRGSAQKFHLSQGAVGIVRQKERRVAHDDNSVDAVPIAREGSSKRQRFSPSAGGHAGGAGQVTCGPDSSTGAPMRKRSPPGSQTFAVSPAGLRL